MIFYWKFCSTSNILRMTAATVSKQQVQNVFQVNSKMLLLALFLLFRLGMWFSFFLFLLLNRMKLYLNNPPNAILYIYLKSLVLVLIFISKSFLLNSKYKFCFLAQSSNLIKKLNNLERKVLQLNFSEANINNPENIVHWK